MFEAITKLYKELGFDGTNLINDIKHDYLTENEARNGRTVLYYLDDAKYLYYYLKFFRQNPLHSM